MESSGNVINHVPRSTRVRESRSLKQRPLPQLPVVIGVHKWSDYRILIFGIILIVEYEN